MKSISISFIKLIIPILIISFSISCQKNENLDVVQVEEIDEVDTNMDTSITLDTNDIVPIEKFNIGDRILFSFLQGESYHDDENFDFIYTADTLELLVTDFADKAFTIQERILPTSTVFQTNENYLKKDSIYSHKWYIRNDSLKIFSEVKNSRGSHIFNFNYKNEIGFPLSEFINQEVKMKGWKTENSYVGSSFDYYTTDFILFDNAYDRLNVMIRNIKMLGDADGWTYLYNRENTFVRVITYSAWTAKGTGWDKI